MWREFSRAEIVFAIVFAITIMIGAVMGIFGSEVTGHYVSCASGAVTCIWVYTYNDLARLSGTIAMIIGLVGLAWTLLRNQLR